MVLAKGIPYLSKNKGDILIVGAGVGGQRIAKELASNFKKSGIVLGFIDDDVRKRGMRFYGLPVLGTRNEIKKIVKENNIKKIVVAITYDLPRGLIEELLECESKGIKIVRMHDLYEELTKKFPLFHTPKEESWFFDVASLNNKGSRKILKRFLDISVSLLGLLFSLPLVPFILVSIKIASEGPVLFKQRRVGRGGKEFKLLKFRTMVKDAENNTGPVWAEENDERVTKAGKFLRRTRLDEIPQLVNVLKGEMSFVGPRPERPHFVSQFRKKIPFYKVRLAVKPGITGWAQTHKEYDKTIDDVKEKLEYDLYYIKNMSPWLDLKILIKTIWVILGRRGAH